MARKPKTNPNPNSILGRPTKYSNDIPDKMIEWFEREPKFEVVGDVKIPPYLPTFERFATRVMRVSVDTLHEWTLHYPAFSEAYKHCKNIQKEHLIQYGLNGLYNPAFAKFVAINCTDMSDSVKLENTNHNINIEIVKDDSN